MAVLSTNDRAAVYLELMNRMSGDREAQPLTKAQLLTAVGAADDWIDANASSYNTALPAAIRNALSPRQKALLLVYVVLKRFDIL
jgi:hypothetical protein